MKLLIHLDHELKHEEEIPGKLGRYCKVHKVIHGRFYQCPEFSFKTHTRIKQEERNHLFASASYALMFLLFVMLLSTGLR